MGKRTEKNLKGGGINSATSRAGDDCSTPEPYTCTGNFMDDFAELWQRSGLDKNSIPVVWTRANMAALLPDDTKILSDEDSEKFQEKSLPTTYSIVDNTKIRRPAIQLEVDIEETKQLTINHAKEMFIRSWRLEDKIINVLQLCSLDRLQCLNLWNAGLNETSIKSLAAFLATLPSLKTLVLDGNPIPDSEPFHLLLSSDIFIITDDDSRIFVDFETSRIDEEIRVGFGLTSFLRRAQQLFLRNNQITDKGAESIGRCLGDPNLRCAVTFLNLSFNRIGDKGASELAKSLRMNRTLLSLSLASNQITDEGCKELAGVVQRFPLNHQEVVQRRKLISQHGFATRGSSAPGSRRGDTKDRPGSNKSGSLLTGKPKIGSSKKKTDAKKPEAPEKTPKKEDRGKKGAAGASDAGKSTKGKKSAATKDGAKRGTAVSSTIDVEPVEAVEFTHPLLDPQSEQVDGKVYISGCMTLVNLNLSRNRIGVAGLECLWTALQYQANRLRLLATIPTAPGLLKLSIQKNFFPQDHVIFLKIHDAVGSRDPMSKPGTKTPDDDMQSVVS